MLKIVDKLKPDNVILIHGDEEALDWMGSSILKRDKNIKSSNRVGREKVEIFLVAKRKQLFFFVYLKTKNSFSFFDRRKKKNIYIVYLRRRKCQT